MAILTKVKKEYIVSTHGFITSIFKKPNICHYLLYHCVLRETVEQPECKFPIARHLKPLNKLWLV